jgi:DNA mismatch repair protein MutL
MHKIKLLSEITINKIAAGEVVERPSAVIKELVENSLDANSNKIDITINAGGRNLIIIADNGSGITKQDLPLAIERHATSKLNEEDIFNIHNFGFRGEALPSIGAVSRMCITSKTQDENHGYSINLEGGIKSEIMPASCNIGTIIEVKDLFYTTPARLKFLKSEKTEQQEIIKIIEKIALTNQDVSFTLRNENKILLNFQATDNLSRLTQVMGKDFIDNAIIIDDESSTINAKLSGYISLPTFNRRTSEEIYLFVNNRPIKDKMLISAVKVAYMDFMAGNRYPLAVLNIIIPTEDVDVNVHPTKAEVRFKDMSAIRSLIIGTLKKAIYNHGGKASSENSAIILEKIIPSIAVKPSFQPKMSIPRYVPNFVNNEIQDHIMAEPNHNNYQALTNINIIEQTDEKKIIDLGHARCQLHKTYILSQTEDSVILIDQHAAHERIVYEKMKESMAKHGLARQRLLMQEIITLTEQKIDLLLQHKDELKKLGLVIDKASSNSIMVSEVPILLGQFDIHKMIIDLSDDLLDIGENVSLLEKIEHISETYSCHASIRSGRVLSLNEMNSLLRTMEVTPHSGQCNHGRPTYVTLKLNDIEKLFGRT